LRIDLARVFEHRLLHGDVLRNVDQHRARTAGTRDVERLLHRRRQVLDVLDQEVVLDHGAGDADGVAFLERVLADRMAGHLAADHHHRDRVHVGGRQAGDRVGDTGAGGDKGDADRVRAARIGIGRVDGSLLVAHQDVLEFVLLVDGVVDVENRAARIAEDVLDALFRKTTHYNLRAREGDGCFVTHDTFLSKPSGRLIGCSFLTKPA
jgi:hypothetical protein